jgi:hypothetical protein
MLAATLLLVSLLWLASLLFLAFNIGNVRTVSGVSSVAYVSTVVGAPAVSVLNAPMMASLLLNSNVLNYQINGLEYIGLTNY